MAGNPLENNNVPEANESERPDLNKAGGIFSHFMTVFQSQDMSFGQKMEFLFDMMIPSLRMHDIPLGENSFKFPMPYFDMDHRILKAGVMTREGYEALRHPGLVATDAFNEAAANLTEEDIIEANRLIADAAASELTEDEIKKHDGKLEVASTTFNEQTAKAFGPQQPETVTEPRPGTAQNQTLTLDS